MLKRHINVCTGGDLCSPFFSNFSETPCMKVSFDVRISPWEIVFSFVSKTLPLLPGNSLLGPVHMLPGQLIASGQLTDPGVNFASVDGLTSITVHINLSLPRATSRGGLPIVQHQVTGFAKVTFLHVNRTQKLLRGKSSLAHAH